MVEVLVHLQEEDGEVWMCGVGERADVLLYLPGDYALSEGCQRRVRTSRTGVGGVKKGAHAPTAETDRWIRIDTCLPERKHGALCPQKPLRLIKDGEVGGSGISYLTPTRYT